MLPQSSSLPSAELQSVVQAALPSEERLHQQLQAQPGVFWERLGLELAPQLSGAEVVIALPGAAALGAALAGALGRPLVEAVWRAASADDDGENEHGGWQLDLAALRGPGTAALATLELQGGAPEAELCVIAQRQGCAVRTLVCALERTTSEGRYHLLQLGVGTVAAVRLALLSDGLILERRSLERAR